VANEAPFDRYSLVHAGFGAWAGARGFGLLPLLGMTIAWEVFEAKYLERHSPDRFTYTQEPMHNRIADVVAALAGWALFLPDRLREDPYVGEYRPWRLVVGTPNRLPGRTQQNG
jgi:hypothetical protein